MLRTLGRFAGIPKQAASSVVFDSQRVAVVVFYLKEGASLPLHDHPGMTVLSKCLHGSLEVTAVTGANSLSSTVITGGEITGLTDSIHAVKALHGPAAFLDILLPPYNDNDCTYYRMVDQGLERVQDDDKDFPFPDMVDLPYEGEPVN